MTVWFTADTHFNHENVIRYSERPFASLEEMTEALVSNWNDAVKRGDSVYHLGDFALSWGRKHRGTIDKILARLNGNKHLVTGNHDRDEVTKNPRWSSVSPYHEIKVDFGDEHKQRVVLCHYSLRVWNQMHRGAWMLHGHSHGNLSDIGGKTMDVGVDCHSYRPVSIEQVREHMQTREFAALDHHSN